MQDRAGDIHVLYTWGRSRIKHVRFNTAWLEGKR
jgi:predicted neuraminidase